jgi:RNA recognition motif-containing protein
MLLFYLFTFLFIYRMNIFIAGLSFKVNDADLSNLFEEYGNITSAKVVTDRMTGRSKGYGFVEMEDNEAATKAITELNGAEFDGRTISVSEARPREERPRREFNNNRGGGYGRDRY